MISPSRKDGGAITVMLQSVAGQGAWYSLEHLKSISGNMLWKEWFSLPPEITKCRYFLSKGSSTHLHQCIENLNCCVLTNETDISYSEDRISHFSSHSLAPTFFPLPLLFILYLFFVICYVLTAVFFYSSTSSLPPPSSTSIFLQERASLSWKAYQVAGRLVMSSHIKAVRDNLV